MDTEIDRTKKENSIMKYIISPLATVILSTILFAFQMTMFIESILLSLLPFIGLILLIYYLFFC